MTNRPLQYYKIIIVTVKLQHVPHNSIGKFTNIYTFRALTKTYHQIKNFPANYPHPPEATCVKIPIIMAYMPLTHLP